MQIKGRKPNKIHLWLRRPKSNRSEFDSSGKAGFKRLNKSGMTIMEMLIAMMICALLLMQVPTLMKMINVNARESLFSIRAARVEHNAIAEMIKDIKSSEQIVISPDSQSVTLKRSASENGIIYTIRDEQLWLNGKSVMPNVSSGSFSMDGSLICAEFDIKDAEPIQLLVRKPSLKKLVDNDNVPAAPDYEFANIGLKMNGSSITTTTAKSIPVVKEYEVKLETTDPMAQIIFYQVTSGGEVFPVDKTPQYVYGNEITFSLPTFTSTTAFKVKVVSEDGVHMQQYTISLNPKSGNSDPVPDWMWGSDEGFRTMMTRVLLHGLGTTTFGEVRNITAELPFALYKVTEVPYIVGELKKVQVMDFSDCLINELPENFGYKMPSLKTLKFDRCKYLDLKPFKDKVNNNAWKLANLAGLTTFTHTGTLT